MQGGRKGRNATDDDHKLFDQMINVKEPDDD